MCGTPISHPIMYQAQNSWLRITPTSEPSWLVNDKIPSSIKKLQASVYRPI